MTVRIVGIFFVDAHPFRSETAGGVLMLMDGVVTARTVEPAIALSYKLKSCEFVAYMFNARSMFEVDNISSCSSCASSTCPFSRRFSSVAKDCGTAGCSVSHASSDGSFPSISTDA